jgi:hypothetical protein
MGGKMDVKFFFGFSGEYEDFLPEKHLEISNRFLCIELSDESKMVVVGCLKLAVHDMLQQALDKSDIVYRKIIGAGILKDGKVIRWISKGSIRIQEIITPVNLRPKILEILGAKEIVKKRYIGYVHDDRTQSRYA